MKICILGTGVMGTGIASLLSLSDVTYELKVWGRKETSIARCQEELSKNISKVLKRSGAPSSRFNEALQKIEWTTELASLAGADLYIEAVQEDINVKRELYEKLTPFLSKNAVVATNTSSLSITELAVSTPNPSKFIGLHFFNPTTVMKLVEITKGLTTSDETVDEAIGMIQRLNKAPVLVNDSPGFIVNRMLIPMINEAISILAEGVATKSDIDDAMKYGANHPMGPLALSDLIGNDVCLSIMNTLYSETGDPKYRPHPLLKQYVRAGMLGRKTKVGFYDYR